MNYPTAIRIAILGVVLGAALGVGASAGTAFFAQQGTPQVMTDTAPLPAEDRGSAGAIVLENSPVRAQRDRDFEGVTPRADRADKGKAAPRASLREQTKSDLQKAREAEAIEFYERGAASGTAK